MKAVLLPNQSVILVAREASYSARLSGPGEQVSGNRFGGPWTTEISANDLRAGFEPEIDYWKKLLRLDCIPASTASRQPLIPGCGNQVVSLRAPKAGQPWYYRLQTQGAAS